MVTCYVVTGINTVGQKDQICLTKYMFTEKYLG